MANYYIHTLKDAQGDHEVHIETCTRLPLVTNREHLGNFNHCRDAVSKAKEKGYKPVNGCYWCCRECHTS